MYIYDCVCMHVHVSTLSNLKAVPLPHSRLIQKQIPPVLGKMKMVGPNINHKIIIMKFFLISAYSLVLLQ